jgi:gliding motility-associated-like protein
MKLKNYLLAVVLFAKIKPAFSNKKEKKFGIIPLTVLLFAILYNTSSYGQTFEPFTIRYSTELKGDMLTIGNNILSKDNNPLNDDTLLNENVSMQYIDIDSDPTTFNSSSADLAVTSGVSCFRIAYAGLYWGAIINSGDSRTDIEKIKFKLPGNSTYTDITGEIIYDAVVAPIVPDSNKPYACYADVTTLVSGLTNPQGTYTAANIKSSVGTNGATGLAAGWTLYVIYEDPTTTTKYMVAYDGFAALYDGRTLDIPISGFQTPPSGTINLKYAFAALNGDKGVSKSKIEISNGTSNGSALTTTQRPSNNFFNAAITNLDSYANSRTPNGTNSLGYDTGIEQILNVNKSTIGNNATTAQITLQVAKGQANPIFSFFNAISINVIAPDIALTKLVKDISGNDIGNTDVGLGTNLYYEIGFQNIGNDNVTNFTLKDVLPDNVIFNYPSDIISLPTGVTHTYNATTRELLFSIPDNLVEVGDVSQTIRLHVQVVSNYKDLLDACSNEIKNQAFASYRGVINTTPRVDEGSFASTICNFGTPSSTNFLVNIDGQTFSSNEVLCGASVQLSGPDGYDSYSWSTSPSGTPVIGTNQNYTATDTGTYYITSTSPCATVTEAITINPFGNTITNPVIPYADEVVICQNNGKELPNIFLCGANATRLIQTNISDASTITWEKLNESSCAAQTVANCANENTACQWDAVGTGSDYLVNTGGQFRVTLNYSGGCFSRFYFNVYQNLLDPTVTTKDIICTTNGKITVGGVPSGYEYSLDGTYYQSSNIFPITIAGSYTVYIKQVGVTTNPCIFSVPNILIRLRNFTGSTITTQPTCNGDKGSIKIAAIDADPQYYYSIYQGATLVNSIGPIAASDYEFADLNPAIYTVRVWTDDGCDYSTDIEIIEPPLLSATSALTKPLTCVDGEITVYPVGGTPPYAYYVNGSTSSQTTPQITVNSSGVYSIQVVDSNDCSTTTSITVAAIPDPIFTVSSTTISCYGDNTAEIKFNVTNANGYTLTYSIDNGVTYSSNPTFSNQIAGTYTAVLKYSLAGTDCFSTPEIITITQPDAALTASAGVSELAGCGTNGEGKIRITNPQGGTPFPSPDLYLYSFDNQTSWITTNEAYLMPGTYTVYVKDANGCIYPMTVTLDTQPPAPTIAVDAATFNCDGTATSTVTVTNNGGSNYSYEYLIDGNLNPNTANPKVFLNVASGAHTISVKYQLLTVSTYSNLLNEDFGTGTDTTSPGINTAFCFEKQNFLTCDKNGTLNNGEYTVTNTIKNGIYSGWHNPVDHTTGSATGRYLAVDAGIAIPNNAILYRKSINDIIPNQPIQVRFFATNLLKVGNTQPDASLTVELQNSVGTALSSQSTGGIPKTDGWVEYNLTINPGNNTTLDFVLRLEVAQVNGIDFAVDDIEVYQLPISCITQKDFPIIIPTDQAFDASITASQNVSCTAANDGFITIAAENFNTTNGFQYSIDGGANWVTQMTSPYTITGLAPATYNVQIRYDASSTGTCVKTFSQTITEPAPIAVNASITSVAKCTIGATITASATGGTAPYQYELRDASGVSVIRAYQMDTQFTDVPAGDYTVFVKDANSCVTANGAALTIVAPPTLTASLDTGSNLCYDSVNQASLIVTTTGGTAPYVYSLDGAPAQNSNIFSNVSIGSHSIIVTDSYGCTAPAITVTIAPQLTAVTSVSKELDCTSSPDAVITVSINGGNSPFTYKVKEGSASYGASNSVTGTSFTYTTATAGSYTFEITDAQGCTTTTSATVNALVPVTLTSTNTNPSCNGATDGSVQLIPAGGAGGYTFSDDDINYSTTSLFTGLAAGDYTFYVKDSKNCPATITVTLTAPVALAITVDEVPFSCNSSNGKVAGTVTINTTLGTGTAPYQYSFNGSGFSGNNVLTLNDNGTDQPYTYVVKDANGCQISGNGTLLKLNPPTAGTITYSAITCNATTATVTVTPTTGTGVGPLTYEITYPASAVTTPQTSNIFNGLAPDTYIFKVTDANGCYYNQSLIVAPVTPITVAGNKTSDVLCFGESSGSGLFTVSGFSDTYSYVFNGQAAVTGQNAPTIIKNGLAVGSYSMTVTDDTTGCTSSSTITITQPSAALALVLASNINANCTIPTSKVTVTASGGTPNYTYSFVQDNAPAGTYTASNTANLNPTTNTDWDIYVKDANGCIYKLDVTIATDPSPTVTADATGQCFGVGSYTITATPGSGLVTPLTYSINNGASYQPGNTFVVNTPGNYTITIKDGNGCTATSNTITVYPKLTLSAVLNKDITCSLPANAQITLTATNGNNTSYTYAYSTDGVSFSSMASNVLNTNTPGSYIFSVTDANGCTAVTTTPIVLTAPVNPEIIDHTQTQDIYCNGESTASIRVNINSAVGLAPFLYSIDGSNFQSSNVFSGLAAGNYTVTLKDSKGCTDTYDLTVNQPDALDYTLEATPITCPVDTPGTITIKRGASGLGGTAPYTYTLTNNAGYTTQIVTNDPGTSDYIFEGLNFATYYITVTDANGCSLKKSEKVASPPDNLDIVVESTADCSTGGTVKVTVGGAVLGAGPFYFAIYQQPYPTTPTFDPITGDVQYPFQAADVSDPKSTIFTGLLQGVYYSFMVYDASTGCSYIRQAETPTIKATTLTTLRVVTDVTCVGANDGTVTITLDTDSTDPSYTPPTTVDYEVYDSKTNLPLSPTPNEGFGIPVGTLPSTMPIIGGLAPGSYYVVITEHGGSFDGCKSATLPFDIYESATALEVTATVVKNDNCNVDAGQIVAIAKGGTTMSREDALAVPPQVATAVPYQYQILPDTGTTGDVSDDTPPLSNDSNWGTTNTFYKEAGYYIVYAMDANKCIQAYPIQLESDDAPTIDTPATICYDGNPFTITITGTVDPTIVGGKTYSVNGSAFQSSPDFTFNAAGTYNLVIKDGNDCTADFDYEVYPQLQLNAAVTKPLDCTTSPNAEITLTASGGNTTPTANYTYEVDNGSGFIATTNPSPATGAGTYIFRVTDANNPTACQATTTITLDPIPTPTITPSVTNVSCNGGADGTITIDVTAGVGPYTYALTSPTTNTTGDLSGTYTGLIAGTTYQVTVTDAKSCTYTSALIPIAEPTLLSTIATLTTPLSCGTGNAPQAATVTIDIPTTGTAPYTYSFNGGSSFSSTNTFTTYTAGTISVMVKDSNGCTFSTTVAIPALDPPTDLDFSGTPVYCMPVASQTSTVTLTSTKGVAPLSYAIVFPTTATTNTTGATNGIFTGLAPDTYLFQVTDANGCTYREAYTVDPVTNISVSGQLISDVTCNGSNNGEIQFTVANFAGTYSYVFNGEAAVTGQNTTTIIKNNLAAGTYPITITDETTGCQATTSVIVSEPTALDLTPATNINANCNFGAQVSVTTSGGIAPYSYSFVPSGTGAGTYTNSTSAVLDPTVSTAWDVWVKDANGCVISSPLAITIATDPLPTVTVNPYSQCPSASGDYTFTINVTSGIAPFQYSIGAGYQSSPTFTVNAAGTYNVVVKDANGCTNPAPFPVTILPALQLQASITALPSCADGDGTLTLTATGGSGIYEYRIDGGSYVTTTNFIGISAGIHTLEVRDTTTGCTFSLSVDLKAATPITGFALSKTDVTCNGGDNGSITATMDTPATGVNDNPVYSYSIDGGATSQTSNVFSGLKAGTYTVEVTSGRGCTAPASITIDEPAVIIVPTPTVAEFGCTAGTNGTNYATITVNGVTGGSGNYTIYEFIKGTTVVQFGTNNSYTEADVLGGTYTVNVYDSNGCMGTAASTVTINPFIALDEINVTVNNAITCVNNEDITVTATTIGGTPASLDYTVEDSLGGILGGVYTQTNTTGIFTGLPIGDYIITVTNPTTTCSIQTVHYVNNPNTFDLTVDSVVDVSCFGGTNGSANITFIDLVATPIDEAGAFNYTIVDALSNSVQSGTSATAGPQTITNLAAGTYTISATLVNSPQCTVSKNFTITQPSAALTIAETHTAITCISGNNDGTISATAIGGWSGGYEFELVGPVNVAYSTQSNFTNLTAGTYTINVRDSKGCIATTMVTLVVPTPITLTATSDKNLLSCFGDKDATITVNSVAGGQGSNYSYTLNMISPTATSSGPQLSPIFSGLGAGTYTVSVMDGYSCTATSSPIIIQEPTKVNASLVVASTQTCNNQTTLTLSATGGTGPYTYSVDNVTYNPTPFASSVTFPVAVGTYAYYVKDVNGCIATVSNGITIDPLPALTIGLDLTNAVINCKGDASGVIVAEAQGGLGNYIYSLLDGSGNAITPTPTQLSPGNFTGLIAGNYFVKVDSEDCSTTSPVITISEPLQQLEETHTVKDVSCNGANNGEIVINATGGTGIIQYAISPNLNQFDDINTFIDLAPGNYDVIVQDQLGCYIKINFDITEPDILTVSTVPDSIVPEICAGDMDGAFSITIGGGLAPYSVSLDDPNGTYTTGTLTQTDFDFTGLTGGNHVVYIRDAAGCTTDWSVPLPESIYMNPMVTVNYDCVNNAAANLVTVTIDASITDPTDVDYSLDGGSYQASNIFTSLAPGTHYVTTRHTNGCEQQTLDFDIVQVDPLTLVINDGGLNEIVATAAGGGGNYQYTLNGESYGSTSNFIIYKSGDYTVTVTDANGCVATATRYFEYIDVCIPNHFTPNGDGIEDGWAPGCTINYKNLTFDIFDRYGRKVATYHLGEYWDGKYNGKELPSGDYWYVVKLNDVKDPREFVGHFTLYR